MRGTRPEPSCWLTIRASVWMRSAAHRACTPHAMQTSSAMRERRMSLRMSEITCAYWQRLSAQERAARSRHSIDACSPRRVTASFLPPLKIASRVRSWTRRFGYDPLFLLPHLDRTMAELDAETRLSLSHRGAALQRLLTLLPALL